MRLAPFLAAGILKKAAIVAGFLLALSAFLFLLNSYGLWIAYGPPISGKGTMTYLFTEDGAGWGIVSDDGQAYKILVDSILGESYFPSEFQAEGLEIEFAGYLHHYGSPYRFLAQPCWSDFITLIDIHRVC